MKNWPKVMDFCDQSWNFINFGPEFYQICVLFANIKKIGFSLDSPHFSPISAKCNRCKNKNKNEQKDG